MTARFGALLVVVLLHTPEVLATPADNGATSTGRQRLEAINHQMRLHTAGMPKIEQKKVGSATTPLVATYPSGWEGRLHDRGVNRKRPELEMAVHITARHLDLPLQAIPAVFQTTVRGRPEAISTWVGDAIKYSWGKFINWESLHAVLLVDHATIQVDRAPYNIHFRPSQKQHIALALDNECCFGFAKNSSPDGGVALMNLVRSAALRDPAASRFSPRIQRGLNAFDFTAWRSDLEALNISSYHLELGASRLRQVKQYGLQAIVPNLPVVN